MTSDPITVICENSGTELKVALGTPLSEIAATLARRGEPPLLAAFVNNRLKELDYKICTPVSVRFTDITSFAGFRVYQRTVWFILQKAVHDLWPRGRLHIRHSLGQSGFYCEIEGIEPPGDAEIETLMRRMRAIVEADYPIVRRKMLTSEVRRRYAERGFDDKIALLDTRPGSTASSTRWTTPSATSTALWPLDPLHPAVRSGALLQRILHRPALRTAPDRIHRHADQEKMFDIFHDYKRWVEIMGVATVGKINEQVLAGNTPSWSASPRLSTRRPSRGWPTASPRPTSRAARGWF